MNDIFLYCPRCGRECADRSRSNVIHCGQCDLQLYRNPAVAVACLVLDQEGKLLLIQRAKEPAKGKWAVPGGFVDFGETAEAALARELREELNVSLSSYRYLTSHTNDYCYRGITYPVLDLFFVGRVDSAVTTSAPEEIAGVRWAWPGEVQPEELAFASMRHALRAYLKNVASNSPSSRL